MKLAIVLVCMLGAVRVFAASLPRVLDYYVGAGEWQDGRGERDSGYLRFLYVTDNIVVNTNTGGKPYTVFALKIGLMAIAPIVLVARISATDTADVYRVTDADGKEIGRGSGGGCLFSGGSWQFDGCKLQLKVKGATVVIERRYTSASLAHVALSGRLDYFLFGGSVDFAGEAVVDLDRTRVCHDLVRRERIEGENDIFSPAIDVLCVRAIHDL